MKIKKHTEALDDLRKAKEAAKAAAAEEARKNRFEEYIRELRKARAATGDETPVLLFSRDLELPQWSLQNPGEYWLHSCESRRCVEEFARELGIKYRVEE